MKAKSSWKTNRKLQQKLNQYYVGEEKQHERSVSKIGKVRGKEWKIKTI